MKTVGGKMLAETDLDAAVMAAIEALGPPVPVGRLYDLLARAGALPDEPLARLYPTHPHRQAIVRSLERLKTAGRFERWGLPWPPPFRPGPVSSGGAAP